MIAFFDAIDGMHGDTFYVAIGLLLIGFVICERYSQWRHRRREEETMQQASRMTQDALVVPKAPSEPPHR